MIAYTSGGIWYFLKLFQMRGSVFPSSILIAAPCAALAFLLKLLIKMNYLEIFADGDSILSQTQAWSGFNFLVGFLIVFRTSQAYNRFWDGCTATHQMRAEWFDACSALIAFSKHSKSPAERITKFKNTLIRLISMLHAAALAELEEVNAPPDMIEDIHAFSFKLIDPAGIDEESLKTIKGSDCKVELLFSWIQFLIVENIETGVLSIPPPLLSRSFQELANGMIAFHDAIKISYIPFPFPYAQTCDCLLVLHWLVVPFVTSQWVTQPVWAAIFVAIQVFILWSLNFIAVEIENPFGTDNNDIDGHHMQSELNRHLLLVLQRETFRTPELVTSACKCEEMKMNDNNNVSFCDVWRSLVDTESHHAARTHEHFTRAFASLTEGDVTEQHTGVSSFRKSTVPPHSGATSLRRSTGSRPSGGNDSGSGSVRGSFRKESLRNSNIPGVGTGPAPPRPPGVDEPAPAAPIPDGAAPDPCGSERDVRVSESSQWSRRQDCV